MTRSHRDFQAESRVWALFQTQQKCTEAFLWQNQMLRLLFYKQLLRWPVENGPLGEELEGYPCGSGEMAIASDVTREGLMSSKRHGRRIQNILERGKEIISIAEKKIKVYTTKWILMLYETKGNERKRFVYFK